MKVAEKFILDGKACTVCKELLPLADFPYKSGTYDGHTPQCRSCDQVRQRAQYLKHRERRLEGARQYRAEGKGAEVMARHRERHPNKEVARQGLRNAIRRGELLKQPCEVCGASDVEAHHCDYTKPLDVMWLCKEHHSEWHRNNKAVWE